MPQSNRMLLRSMTATSLAGYLLVCVGCQTWRSTSAIPGLAAKRNEAKVLEQAKNDPFPSPADVGMKVSH